MHTPILTHNHKKQYFKFIQNAYIIYKFFIRICIMYNLFINKKLK